MAVAVVPQRNQMGITGWNLSISFLCGSSKRESEYVDCIKSKEQILLLISISFKSSKEFLGTLAGKSIFNMNLKLRDTVEVKAILVNEIIYTA